MNEATRKQQNAERLKLIDASIRNKVAAVVADLEKQKLKPLIHGDVFRSPERQLQLFNGGVSKVKWSFHNAKTAAGKPGSLAADIVDATKGWNVTQDFWLRVGACALKRGLNWGGFFGVPQNLRAGLRESLLAGKRDPRMKIGWDPAHVETARVTLQEARQGKR